MSLKDDNFPASAAFDLINSSLQSDETERKEAMKAGNAIFAFTLKNSSGKTASWHIDLKEKGVAGKGTAPQGKKPTVTLSLSDADFQKLIDQKANAQSMFMSGKLKLKGNMMAAQKLAPVLNRAASKAKL